jgi:hypothetical protein
MRCVCLRDDTGRTLCGSGRTNNSRQARGTAVYAPRLGLPEHPPMRNQRQSPASPLPALPAYALRSRKMIDSPARIDRRNALSTGRPVSLCTIRKQALCCLCCFLARGHRSSGLVLALAVAVAPPVERPLAMRRARTLGSKQLQGRGGATTHKARQDKRRQYSTSIQYVRYVLICVPVCLSVFPRSGADAALVT